MVVMVVVVVGRAREVESEEDPLLCEWPKAYTCTIIDQETWVCIYACAAPSPSFSLSFSVRAHNDMKRER